MNRVEIRLSEDRRSSRVLVDGKEVENCTRVEDFWTCPRCSKLHARNAASCPCGGEQPR